MTAQYYNPGANIETLLYGCKIGDPAYMEEILYQCKGHVNKDEIMKQGQTWAIANGYDRLRISVVDLSTPPDFKGTVTI